VAEKEILSVKEVAALLGCSPSHVRRLLKRQGALCAAHPTHAGRTGTAHQARGGTGVAGNAEAGNRRDKWAPWRVHALSGKLEG